MAAIFICYRRCSGSRYANHLHSFIERHCGAGTSYLDIRAEPDIKPIRLRNALRREIVNCETFIAVIDPHWDCERLSQRLDYVRFEIKQAMQNRKTIQLLLVGGARMPNASQLSDLPKYIQDFFDWRGYDAPTDAAIDEFVQKLCHSRVSRDDLSKYLITLNDWLAFSDKTLSPDPDNYIDFNAPPRTSLWGRSRRHGQPDIESILQGKKVSAIVGPPDSGKSLTLRRLTRSQIEKYRDNKTPQIPVWVDLKPYRTTEDFEVYFWRWLDGEAHPTFHNIRQWLPRQMENDGVLLLLDGLDTTSSRQSASSNQQGSPLKSIDVFMKKYPRNRYVFACRNLGDGLTLSSNPIALRDLDDQQIKKYLQKAGLDLNTSTLGTDLLDLCRNPFRLHMLVIYWKTYRELPQHLGDLYSEFMPGFIGRAIGPGPEVPIVQAMLSNIALALASQSRDGSSIPLEDLRRAVVLIGETAVVLRTGEDEERLFNCVQGGLLIVDSRADTVGFVDRKLQDYLAACALKNRLEQTDRLDVINTCLRNYILRETLSYLVAISKDQDELVRQIVSCAIRRERPIARARGN